MIPRYRRRDICGTGADNILMINKPILLISILILVLGCGLADRVQKTVSNESASNSVVANVNANKSLTDKAIDTAVGGEKVGIPECDEALDMLEAQANNPDDGWVVKAGKKTALTMFRDQLKKSMEQNQTNKTEVARFCREFRDNLAESITNANANTTQ